MTTIILLPFDYLFSLDESSVTQLASNTRVFFDTPREQTAKRVQIIDTVYVPAVGEGLLTVKATVRGSKGKYTTSIMFEKVRYVEQGTQYAAGFTAVDGKEYFVLPLRQTREDVKVNCTCLDFYYRFAAWNQKDKSLNGEPPKPYIKKGNREPVNPDQVPGVCKHILKLADTLKIEHLLK